MSAMDDLENALSMFAVSIEPNNIVAPHPRFVLHKVKQSSSSQAERRRQFLEAQKLKRFDYINHARGLATESWQKDANDEDHRDEENMDCEVYEKPPRSYKNQYKKLLTEPAEELRLGFLSIKIQEELMMSEWLVEVPVDLATNWFLVLCPIGKRSLVVASKNSTKAYSRSGYRLNTFPSNLPGGNRKNEKRTYSLLDCIYSEVDKTYYILDIICWNGHQVYDSDTEFRFYWIDTKVKENPTISTVSSSNPYKFVPLPYYSCDQETLKRVVNSPLPFSVKLDGLLFFHKQVHYIPGATPLIGWLKGYMVPEILGIDVSDELLVDKPTSYRTMKEYVPKAFQKNEERKIEEEKLMQCEAE